MTDLILTDRHVLILATEKVQMHDFFSVTVTKPAQHQVTCVCIVCSVLTVYASVPMYFISLLCLYDTVLKMSCIHAASLLFQFVQKYKTQIYS